MDVLLWILVAVVLGYFGRKYELNKRATEKTTAQKATPQPGPAFSKKGNKQANRGLNHYSRSELLEVAFSYIDAAGNFTQREVTVNQVTGTYVKGWCHERRAARTFRLDSIIQDITLLSTGEVISVNDWARAVRKNG